MAKFRFTGSYAELRATLEPENLDGEWVVVNENLKTFRDRSGGVLSFYDSTGTLLFQGQDTARDALQTVVMNRLSRPQVTVAPPPAAVPSPQPEPPQQEANSRAVVTPQPAPIRPPEIELGQTFSTSEAVIALVGAVGTDLGKVTEYLRQRLERAYECSVSVVKVSREIISKISSGEVPKGEYERIDTLMTRGNEARKATKDNSILALGVAAAISADRLSATTDGPRHRPRRIYIVDSLKRPEEVNRLREVYANGFYLLGVHTDEKIRLRDLKKRAIDDEQADALNRRDARERVPHGQRTSDTFHLSDFFIHVGDSEKLWKGSVDRIIEILFGNPHRTPLFDEYAMFMAFSASLRSADLSRQVGAVIARNNEIIATGANDVPQFGGGQYWPICNPDGEIDDVRLGRDSTLGEDANKAQVRRIIERIVTSYEGDDEEKAKLRKVLGESDLADLTEYGRIVHAEMEAILSCARNNVSTRGATLYCTTFPCHNCAKHIVGAGIARVVYVEPYPKSKAVDLHGDAISLGFYDEVKAGLAAESKLPETVIFEPFVGLGPRRFFDLFSMKLSSGFPLVRKTEEDRKAEWESGSSRLRVQMLPFSYLDLELAAATKFKALIEEVVP